jgi:quercetin dioxygenase-like cupin family protein
MQLLHTTQGDDPMKPTKAILLLALASFAAASWAQNDSHKMVTPAELKWSDVPSLPAGAKIAVLEGPMNEAVPFTVRLKFPAKYRIPPHFHPATERVTVLSGTFHMGQGEKFDRKNAKALKAGAIAIMQPKTPHFAWTSGETIVQLHGTGPWGVTYVNPADDPRKK